MLETATAGLAAALASPFYLSTDAAHGRALDRTLTQLALLERDWRGHAFTAKRASR
jgi:hypothetical protein